MTLHMAVRGMRKTTPIESWKKVATITKIMVVSKDEYSAGVVPAAGNGATKKGGSAVCLQVCDDGQRCG